MSGAARTYSGVLWLVLADVHSSSHSVGYVSLQHRFLEGELAPDSLMAADVIKMKFDRR